MKISNSPSQIQYTLFTETEDVKFSQFFETAFQFLRLVPKDILQLSNTERFYEFYQGYRGASGILFFTINPLVLVELEEEERYKALSSYFAIFSSSIINVFIVDTSITNHQFASDFINNTTLSYVFFIGDLSTDKLKLYNSCKILGSVQDFIKDLVEKGGEIGSQLGLKLEFEVSNSFDANIVNPLHRGYIAENNYLLINQIIGNHWHNPPEQIKPDGNDLFKGERVKIQVLQIQQLDKITRALKANAPITPIETVYSPLVVIAPYHFPRYKQWNKRIREKDRKAFIELYQSEQKLDYTIELTGEALNKIPKQIIQSSIVSMFQQLLVLDKVGYLHALLTYSPIFRLPVIGRSINVELSHFQQNFSTRQKAAAKIMKLGNIMRERLIDDQFKELLLKRNGQLVVLTDLPIEWLILSNLPLSMTHDVCRIPEFNLTSSMNESIKHQRLNFSIPANIVERTLVIHSASKKDIGMQQAFSEIEALKGELNFTSAFCNNLEEVKEAVHSFDPLLLIFDCHGGFDEKTLSSFLILDDPRKVRLTGDQIIEHGISAPIVFISACQTMPNYGYIKLLSDAFFQAGALTVTATYLPISINEGARVIRRILRNLHQHQDRIIHFNWLAFISHTLRGEFVHSVIEKLTFQEKRNDINSGLFSEVLLDLMVFDRRTTAWNRLSEYLKSIGSSITSDFWATHHEWLSYTTIGRADLIYFENWRKKHRDVNLDLENADID
ncbi:CHAT domain-containing protein [Dyadobacter sp. NIV53]|uniref:CHAT domain-containing protein n=1 Tax=Dyadobacter sp. NIV53 TaxID=2861765 RepID=UPI001C8842D5|nr:CHAT domain-containing protein [Dyadobacter sp. NIV53]